MSTPMLKQYNEIKGKYQDELLFFRLGDFYELFYEDAKIASEILGITLTKKSKEIPMCGVPHHSADSYIAKLVEHNYRVAICEQLEDARLVKGIVKRDVVRIITPGSILDSNVLDETKNSYIMCIFQNDKIDEFGISVVDVSTGEFLTTEMHNSSQKILFDEIGRFKPKEIIVNQNFQYREEVNRVFLIMPRITDEKSYNYNDGAKTLGNHFGKINLEKDNILDYILSTRSSSGLFNYLNETQKIALLHLKSISFYNNNHYMTLDLSTRRNLELTESLLERKKKGTLLSVLDKTKTSMGARLLNKIIEQPLINKKDIDERLDAVEELKFELIIRNEIQAYLKNMFDVERLISKIVYNTANPKDVLAINKTLERFPKIIGSLNSFNSELLNYIKKNIETFSELESLLTTALNEEAPINLKDGNVINFGFNEQLDEYRKIKDNGKNMLLELETKERGLTNIKNIKIKYNKVYGYFFEVTNSNLNMVPDRFIRKQTLTNCERFITEELKSLEEKILMADEKILLLETEIFNLLKEEISKQIEKIQKTAHNIAYLDVLQSFAQVSDDYNYSKPTINEDGDIHIVEGRHPVVERSRDLDFISNDVELKKHKIMLITGPNMAGKSTYMRQVALITVLAQIGSFVPANSAYITPVDRIFTRIGASDNLATGESTFMVEMNEVANILKNATSNSLLIVDEIGRGTSTFDGISIALSVLEHMAKEIKAKTLFATHYHELTEVAKKIDNVENYSVAIKEENENIIFLHKIQKGSIDHSYGIHVAKLAGIPEEVINNAKNILLSLEESEKSNNNNANETGVIYYNEKENTNSKILLNELEKINVDDLTPRLALKKLYELKALQEEA